MSVRHWNSQPTLSRIDDTRNTMGRVMEQLWLQRVQTEICIDTMRVNLCQWVERSHLPMSSRADRSKCWFKRSSLDFTHTVSPQTSFSHCNPQSVTWQHLAFFCFLFEPVWLDKVCPCHEFWTWLCWTSARGNGSEFWTVHNCLDSTGG